MSYDTFPEEQFQKARTIPGDAVDIRAIADGHLLVRAPEMERLLARHNELLEEILLALKAGLNL